MPSTLEALNHDVVESRNPHTIGVGSAKASLTNSSVFQRDDDQLTMREMTRHKHHATEENETVWVDEGSGDGSDQQVIQMKQSQPEFLTEIQTSQPIPLHRTPSPAASAKQNMNLFSTSIASTASTRSTRSTHSQGMVDFGFSPIQAQNSGSGSPASALFSHGETPSPTPISRTSSTASEQSQLVQPMQREHTAVPIALAVQPATGPPFPSDLSMLESMRELTLDGSSLSATLTLDATQPVQSAVNEPQLSPSSVESPTAPTAVSVDSKPQLPKQHSWVWHMDAEEEQPEMPAVSFAFPAPKPLQKSRSPRAAPKLEVPLVTVTAELPSPESVALDMVESPPSPLRHQQHQHGSSIDPDASQVAQVATATNCEPDSNAVAGAPNTEHEYEDEFEPDVEPDLLHDVSIDTLAQLHQHQNWTPFVSRRRGAGIEANSIPNSARKLPAANVNDSDYTTPRRNHRAHKPQEFDLDLSAITPMRPEREIERELSEMNTPFSSKKIPRALPDLQEQSIEPSSPSFIETSDRQGPFPLPTEEECDAFFRNRPSSPRSPPGVQLYDPITDTVMDLPAHVDVHVTGADGHRGDGSALDEDAEEIEQEAAHESDQQYEHDEFEPEPAEVTPCSPIPSSHNHNHIDAPPFGSPCSPLHLSSARSADSDSGSARLQFVTAAADESFSFSPAPATKSAPSIVSTPSLAVAPAATTSFKTPAKVSKLSSHPISILKTSITTTSSLHMQPSPAMLFTLGALIKHEPADVPFGALQHEWMLSPIAPRQEATVAIGLAPIPKIAPEVSVAPSKSVRFDVPPSTNTTANSSAGEMDLSGSAAAIPATAVPDSFSLHSAQELSAFDATAAEIRATNEKMFGTRIPPETEQQHPNQVQPSPFRLAPSVSSPPDISFCRGVTEAEADELLRLTTSAVATPAKHRLSTTMQSQTMNSFFVPFETIDRSASVIDAPLSVSTDHSAATPFRIVVEGPASSTATTVAAPLEVPVFPDSSFRSSSEEDLTELDRSHVATATVAPITPSFLRVPGKRGRKGSLSGSRSGSTKYSTATPAHRTSITRAHTNSANTVRIRVHHHRKAHDVLTGRKTQRSMRIFPSSSNHTGNDANRTLTFNNSSMDSVEESLHVTPISATQLQISHHHQPHHVASPSRSPTRKHLDFSDADFSPSHNSTSFLSDYDDSSSRSPSHINLSETFEQITVFDHTTMQTKSPNLKQPTYKDEPVVSSFSFSPTASPVAPGHFMSPSSSLKYGMYDAVSPMFVPDLHSSTRHTDVIPPSSPSTTGSTLYAQHVVASKLHTHFHPHTVEAAQMRARWTQQLSPTRAATGGVHAKTADTFLPAFCSGVSHSDPSHGEIPPAVPHDTFPIHPSVTASSMPTLFAQIPLPVSPVAGSSMQPMYVPVQMYLCISPLPNGAPGMQHPPSFVAVPPSSASNTFSAEPTAAPSMPWSMQSKLFPPSCQPMHTEMLASPTRSNWNNQHWHGSPVSHLPVTPLAPSPSMTAARHRLCMTLARS